MTIDLNRLAKVDHIFGVKSVSQTRVFDLIRVQIPNLMRIHCIPAAAKLSSIDMRQFSQPGVRDSAQQCRSLTRTERAHLLFSIRRITALKLSGSARLAIGLHLCIVIRESSVNNYFAVTIAMILCTLIAH
ncbi:MAG: hypothetical protein AB8B51_10925 [Sedimentitalea sp.]